MLIGVVQVLAGFGVLAKNSSPDGSGSPRPRSTRLPSGYLSWSLAMFTLDILVMHGLLVDGSRTVRPV